MLDEIARKLASLRTVGTMFVVAASIASGMGLTGAAVITTADLKWAIKRQLGC